MTFPNSFAIFPNGSLGAALGVAPVVQPVLAPLPWLVLDIETANPPEDAIQAEIAAWKPAANVKNAETIERQRAEAEPKIREKAGLLDCAPVACVAINSRYGMQVWHWLPFDGDIPNATAYPAADERQMLYALRAWLDQVADTGTVLVGHSVRGFDLPKLRLRYALHGLRLPLVFQPNPEIRVDDTMKLFARYFLIGDNPFVSLEEMARKLGIAGGEKVLTGKEVPAAIADGRCREVLTYCANDVYLETLAWKKLTSQIGE